MDAKQTEKLPKTGDTLRCEQCGMELSVGKDCHCETDDVCLECCGQPLTYV